MPGAGPFSCQVSGIRLAFRPEKFGMMSQRSLRQDLADILRHSLGVTFGRKSGAAADSAPGASEGSAELPVDAAQLGALALVELSKDAGIWSSPSKVDLDWALDDLADDDSLLDDLMLRLNASPDDAEDDAEDWELFFEDAATEDTATEDAATEDAATGSLGADPALDDIFAPVPVVRKQGADRRAIGRAPLPSDPDLDDILSPEPPRKR